MTIGLMRAACRSDRRAGGEDGFTLIELMVSVAIMLIVTGSIFQMAGSSQSTFRTQPEASDMQQRLRVATDLIYRDLLMAGAGMDRGAARGPLSNYFPSIRPGRRGLQTPDGDLSFAADKINILYVPPTRAQASLLADLSSTKADVLVNLAWGGCAAGTPCAFLPGMRAVIFDSSGAGAGYDVFTVTGTTPTTVQHAGLNLAFTKPYLKNTTMLVEVNEHGYYYDAANSRLMHYDGYQGDDVLVDNVVGVNFTYFADPDPNSAPKPAAGLANCMYNSGEPPVPLLANLGGATLKPLTAAQLTDGPICGSGTNRFDGDLLRVRKVRVSIKVQASRSELRGGDAQQTSLSKSGQRLIPDYTMTFEVSPRNLNLIR